jgi:hypothetical protein
LAGGRVKFDEALESFGQTWFGGGGQLPFAFQQALDAAE